MVVSGLLLHPAPKPTPDFSGRGFATHAGPWYTASMPKILTVSEFVESIRGLLRETYTVVTVQGEVTNYRTRRDELVYFELKDESSRVLCFGLRHEVRTTLRDGMEVRVTGAPSLFKGSGGFHLRVVEIELVGEGALRQAFEALRRRLEGEGLFRLERKRPLPVFPETIGLVTSPDGEAFRDVRRIVADRWPLVRLQLAPVAVQGSGAARQIVRALEHFSHGRKADIVILTRGGGSIEDLQAFNDERVARAIYASSAPVVVGVGHERDVTIADYVADRRASTPSNAAELAVPDVADVLHRIDVALTRSARGMAGRLTLERRTLDERLRQLGSSVERRTHELDLGLERFRAVAARFGQRLSTLRSEVEHTLVLASAQLAAVLGAARTRLTAATTRLQSLSPLAILERGYSLTSDAEGRIVRRSRDLSPGDGLRTRFGEGQAASTVTEVT